MNLVNLFYKYVKCAKRLLIRITDLVGLRLQIEPCQTDYYCTLCIYIQIYYCISDLYIELVLHVIKITLQFSI